MLRSHLASKPKTCFSSAAHSGDGHDRRPLATPCGAPAALRVRLVSGAAAPCTPPTPASISVAEPGGDASDPHAAALLRQLSEPWGARNDKDDQVHVPTPDWEHWKRVRFWGIDHFAGFRYGADHHVVSILLVQDAKAGDDSRACLRRFELEARARLNAFDVQLGRASERETVWRDTPIAVRSVDGSLALGFSRREFSAAWTAYRRIRHVSRVCHGRTLGHPTGARAAVRDRWAPKASSAWTR